MTETIIQANITASELDAYLEQAIKTNMLLASKGRNKKAICVWGGHGKGKTDVIKAFALRTNIGYAELNPAQMEEMGDFIGMPVIENDKMIYKRPSWTPDPDDERPGIFLIDDFNRAPTRILAGFMQLFQDYKLVSWAIPKNWTIVCTANPENEGYAVEHLDPAIKTRFQHLNFVFEIDEWLKWASSKSEINDDIIQFIAQYHESMEINNPRQFSDGAEFLSCMFEDVNMYSRDVKNFDRNAQIAMGAAWNPRTVSDFINFVENGIVSLPTIEDIGTGAVNIEAEFERIYTETGGAIIGISRLLLTRLSVYIEKNYYTMKKRDAMFKNFIKMLCNHRISNDLRNNFIDTFWKSLLVTNASGVQSLIPISKRREFNSTQVEVKDVNGNLITTCINDLIHAGFSNE
jgi:hypothetical protein